MINGVRTNQLNYIKLGVCSIGLLPVENDVKLIHLWVVRRKKSLKVHQKFRTGVERQFADKKPEVPEEKTLAE